MLALRQPLRIVRAQDLRSFEQLFARFRTLSSEVRLLGSLRYMQVSGS